MPKTTYLKLTTLIECCQTSDIESFNNLVLKYADKSIIVLSFTVFLFFVSSWLRMIMRTCLACLDWNNNVDRALKIFYGGKNGFLMVVHIVNSGVNATPL